MNDKIKNELKEWCKTVILSIIIYLFISIFIFSTRVDGLSMYPILNNGDFLITTRTYLNKGFDQGDIIVFKSSGLGKILIKRVIGVEGDTVKIENKKVYVNGVELKENYINNETLENLEIKVEEGTYFVMGDNRQNSMDSRYDIVGLVKEEDVMGKAVLRFFPSPKLIKKGE